MRIVEAHAAVAAEASDVTAPVAGVSAGPEGAAADGGEQGGAGSPRLLPGDVVRLEMSATVVGDGAPSWPSDEELGQALGGRAVVVEALEAEGPGPAEAPGLAPSDGATWTKTWRVQLLVPPGEHELGPFAVGVEAAEGGVVDTSVVPAVSVTVQTSLPEELAAELDAAAEAADENAVAEVAYRVLAPVRGPWQVERPFPTGGVLAALGLLLLLALLAAWLWRRRRGPVAAPAAPREPAEVEARRRLDALVAGELIDRGEHLAHHVELSDALKTYLGRRHGEDFLDRTTSEVRRLLHGPLADEPGVSDLRGEVVDLLARCDLVKFARDVPPREESIRCARAARGIVDRTQRAFEVRAELERQRNEAAAKGGGSEPPMQQRGAA